jgi:hypothetical protein
LLILQRLFCCTNHPDPLLLLLLLLLLLPQYTSQVVVLLAARWAVYRAKRWHYYLLDFCYFANLLLLVHLWLAPSSALLSKVTQSSRRNCLLALQLCLRQGVCGCKACDS